MLQSPWKPMVCIAAGGLLVLALGVPSALHAEAADAGATDAELVDRLVADQMTREQLAGMYAGLSGATYQPPACTAGQPRMFTDVAASNPFCPWIEELARRGITGGCTANEYCPGGAVTRSQMAIFIVRALEQADGCRPAIPGTGEMVKVGGVCIDKYENSVWTQPDGGQRLTTQGQISAFCPADGQDCKDMIFARSVPGVEPARNITWFQAQQALANSGKRLPSNAEWQMAASGTPDGTPCNVSSSGPVNTGSAVGCISDWGVNDMVGNVNEWVADWVPASTTTCPGWGDIGEFSSDDFMCLSGASDPAPGPGALIRGGDWSHGTDAGPFTVFGNIQPSSSNGVVGFRGAR